MTKVKVEWNDMEVKKKLTLSMEERMGVACLKLEAQAKNNILNGSSGLHSRTGALAGSISSNWTGRPGIATITGIAKRSGAEPIGKPGGRFPVINGVVGSNLAYARIHELGGTIRPRRAKYLTIPLPATLTAQSGASRGRARDFRDTFIKRSKAGNLIIFRENGGSITPLFVLKKSVSIPARPYLRPAMERGASYIIKLFRDL